MLEFVLLAEIDTAAVAFGAIVTAGLGTILLNLRWLSLKVIELITKTSVTDERLITHMSNEDERLAHMVQIQEGADRADRIEREQRQLSIDAEFAKVRGELNSTAERLQQHMDNRHELLLDRLDEIEEAAARPWWWRPSYTTRRRYNTPKSRESHHDQ